MKEASKIKNEPARRIRNQKELTYTLVRPEPYEINPDKFIREIAKFVNLLM